MRPNILFRPMSGIFKAEMPGTAEFPANRNLSEFVAPQPAAC